MNATFWEDHEPGCTLWEEHLKSLVVALTKAPDCLNGVSQSTWMAAKVVGAKILQKMRDGPCWEGVWPYLDPWDVLKLRTTASVWNVPGKYGPHGELFFFLKKKEPFVLTKAVEFRPLCYCGDTESMCIDWFALDGRRKRL